MSVFKWRKVMEPGRMALTRLGWIPHCVAVKRNIDIWQIYDRESGSKYWCVFVEEILWASHEKSGGGGGATFTLRCIPNTSGRLFSLLFYYHGAIASSGPDLPHYRGFTITLIETHYTWQKFSGTVINPTPRPLPDNTRQSQETDIHVSGRTRTSKRAAADPRLHGQWDRLFSHRRIAKSNVNDVLRQILSVTAWCACLKISFRPAYIPTAPSRDVPIITAVLAHIKYIFVRIWMWICYKHLDLIEFWRKGAFRRVGTYPFALFQPMFTQATYAYG